MESFIRHAVITIDTLHLNYTTQQHVLSVSKKNVFTGVYTIMET